MAKNIYITESQFRKILESAGDLEYHFTPLENLCGMMEDDALDLTDGDYEEGRNGLSFLSLSRLRSSAAGYGWGMTRLDKSTGPVARIEFDGRKLNNIRNVNVRPYNYFYNNIGRNWKSIENSGSDASEFEDSLTLKDGRDQIVDAIDYITRIDVYLSDYCPKLDVWQRFLDDLETYGDWAEKMHFYTDLNGFDYQRNEIPKSQIYGIYSGQMKQALEEKKALREGISHILPPYEQWRKNNTYLNDILAGIDEKEYMKSRPRHEEDMQKMSDMMVNLEDGKKENFMINEDFSSPILSKMAKEHGGIQISRNGGLRQFPCAFLRGNGVNPSEITDDMIVGEPFEYSPYDRKSDNAVLFNDGTAIALDKNAELPRRTSGQRRNDRYGSGIGDTGDHDKSRSGFVGKGKDAVSSPYNGWQSSERAGYSQSLRDAYKINKKMGDEKTANDILNKARNIYITESQLSRILAENGMIDEHIAVIDNSKDVEKLISMQWTSPDDYWFIQVTQRKKDFRNYNKRHGGNSKWWNRVQGVDGTSRENFAGYGVVKGNTLQDAIDCLHNIKIKLNPWAAQIIGQNEVKSNGGMEAIYDICNKLWARAYITINKRSMSRTQKIAQKGGLRAFEKESSRNHRDAQYYPWSMIDMDIDDPNAASDTDSALSKLKINPAIRHSSHDGTHYFFDNRDIMKYSEHSPEFSPIARKYAASKQPGEAFTMKEDAKMIIYSPCGQ